MSNQVVWVDIPVRDLNRAMRFHSAVIGQEVKRQEFPGRVIGILPHAEGEVGGCLFKKEGEEPSAKGPLLHLNVAGRLDAAIAQVGKHGGKVLAPKHPIGPYGQRAIIQDSEGNRLALHSM